PVDLFVPVIAVSRIAGWTANLLEQYQDNRLIRPRADYVGPAARGFRPLSERGA
ncbi:MAG TPA: citrate/2-methylcitrate synthase, partial [Methylomirabilota bacterium]|nr:citrate/2-methylcitrate synthase [Methylomirabilota bacterium]